MGSSCVVFPVTKFATVTKAFILLITSMLTILMINAGWREAWYALTVTLQVASGFHPTVGLSSKLPPYISFVFVFVYHHYHDEYGKNSKDIYYICDY